MATMVPEQEALNETCRVFNVQRESENSPERMHPVFVLTGTKKSPSMSQYGVSLTIGLDKGIPQHRFITVQISGLDQVSDGAKAINQMLKDAMSESRVSKLPWSKEGEKRTGSKRWSGPFKDEPS